MARRAPSLALLLLAATSSTVLQVAAEDARRRAQNEARNRFHGVVQTPPLKF